MFGSGTGCKAFPFLTRQTSYFCFLFHYFFLMTITLLLFSLYRCCNYANYPGLGLIKAFSSIQWWATRCEFNDLIHWNGNFEKNDEICRTEFRQRETRKVQVQEPVGGNKHRLCFANKAAVNQSWRINIQFKSSSSSVSTFIFKLVRRRLQSNN